MKLTGPFTVDALYCAELSGPDWEDYISLSQVNDQSGSQRENQESYFSADWTFCQLKTNTNIRMVKERYYFFSADKLLSDAI